MMLFLLEHGADFCTVLAFMATKFFSAVDLATPTLFYGVADIPEEVSTLNAVQQAFRCECTPLLQGGVPKVVDRALGVTHNTFMPLSFSRHAFDALVDDCRKCAQQAISQSDRRGLSVLWPSVTEQLLTTELDDIRNEIEIDDTVIVLLQEQLSALVCNIFLEELRDAMAMHEAAQMN